MYILTEFLRRYGAVVRGEGVNVGKETNIQVIALNWMTFDPLFLPCCISHGIIFWFLQCPMMAHFLGPICCTEFINWKWCYCGP